MADHILWNHADDKEGFVSRREWSYCRTRNCSHVGHASSFTFPITIIRGKALWEGDYGEKLVHSKETGRLFFTKYEDRGPWRPVVVTYEIVSDRLPTIVEKNLEFKYGSMQHHKVVSLMNILRGDK
jgi:hypothetical protein